MASATSGRTLIATICASSTGEAVPQGYADFQLPVDVGAVYVTLTGTFVGTLQFEQSGNGSTFVASTGINQVSLAGETSATAPGQWRFNGAGLLNFRVRCSAYTSGTVTATINASASAIGDVTTSGPASAHQVAVFSSADNLIGVTPSTAGFVFSSAGTGSDPLFQALAASQIPAVPVLISTTGAVADPGGVSDFQFNNAAGALTFNAPDGVAGWQRSYRNATGKSGAITIQMATGNTVDLDGVNSSSAGTIASAGALGDAVTLVCDATHHWYAYVSKGTWSTT